MYSKGAISKSTFNDPAFKEMLQAIDPSVPLLSVRALKGFIKSEFDVFLMFLAFDIANAELFYGDTAFLQLMHDGGTANNGSSSRRSRFSS